MKIKRKVRPDPVILEMRLSQVRDLIARLSHVHSELGYVWMRDAHSGLSAGRHCGWAMCECQLAKDLRTFSRAIQKHLGLMSPYQVEAEKK